MRAPRRRHRRVGGRCCAADRPAADGSDALRGRVQRGVDRMKANSGMRVGRRRLRLASVVVATGLALAVPYAHAQDAADAKAILKSMSDYVSSQKTIELTFDSDIEVITPQLEKIQFTNSGELLLSRPDKLRAHRIGGYSEVELVFDGKTVSVLGTSINGYAQID